MKNSRFLPFLLLAGFIHFAPVVVHACGPFFDNAYFIRMSKDDFLAIPNGNFYFELKQITHDTTPVIEIKEDPPQRVADADIQDLKQALLEQKVKGDELTDAVTSYQYYRNQIILVLDTCKTSDEFLWYGGGFRNNERQYDEAVKTLRTSLAQRLPVHLPSKIPQEFQLYLSGAVKYHSDDYTGSIGEWEKILKLPKRERHYKSTWAAYMIGMANLSMREQEKAIPYFIKTRNLAKSGYSDSLNLALESYGWQALAEFELNDPVSSIKHYLKQVDADSLNLVCEKISETKDDTLDKVLKDKTGRKVLLGWAVSQPNEMNSSQYVDFNNRLLTKIEGFNKTFQIEYADRIAWLYYSEGNMTTARSWLRLSKPATPLAQYIDFKLTLRDGKIDSAIQKLSAVIPTFEQSKDTEMFASDDFGKALHSEMAVLKLSRKDYISTFELTWKGRYWEDIAYMAEKVLTTKEVEDVLHSNQNNPALLIKQNELHDFYFKNDEGPNLMESLEYLLARRLARQGDWNKAIEYMPTKVEVGGWNGSEEINPKLKIAELRDLILEGSNKQLPNQERAQAYYDAGLITRKYGMELLGTELDPDGYIYDGEYPYEGTLNHRFAILTDKDKLNYYGDWGKEEIKKIERLREEIKKNPGFFYGSHAEEKRVFDSFPSPNKRFHYRYKAADLMWKSAQLLPDNDELKAKALCQGGTFIKMRDPKYADKFYKTLVKTCPKTELGKTADKTRWFPILKD